MQKISKNQLSGIAKLKQKKFRDLGKEYLLSGLNVVSTALGAERIRIKAYFVRAGKEDYLEKLNFAKHAQEQIPVYTLSEREFRLISDEEAPQGVALLAVKPEPLPIGSDLVLYLDRINDPGNLGAIIRTACWFGVKDILLSPGSADPYQPKAVRASAGLISHINIIEHTTHRDLIQLKSGQGFSVAGTYPGSATPVSLLQNSGKGKMILAFGSEAHGLPDEMDPIIDQRIMIPASGPGESLNLAVSVGIILSQLKMNHK